MGNLPTARLATKVNTASPRAALTFSNHGTNRDLYVQCMHSVCTGVIHALYRVFRALTALITFFVILARVDDRCVNLNAGFRGLYWPVQP